MPTVDDIRRDAGNAYVYGCIATTNEQRDYAAGVEEYARWLLGDPADERLRALLGTAANRSVVRLRTTPEAIAGHAANAYRAVTHGAAEYNEYAIGMESYAEHLLGEDRPELRTVLGR